MLSESGFCGGSAFFFREPDKNYYTGSTHHMKGPCIQNIRTICNELWTDGNKQHKHPNMHLPVMLMCFLSVVCFGKTGENMKRTGYSEKTHKERISNLARPTEGQGWITPYSTPIPDKIKAQPSCSKETGSMSWRSGCWNLTLTLVQQTDGVLFHHELISRGKHALAESCCSEVNGLLTVDSQVQDEVRFGGRLTKSFWQRASWIWVRLHGELCSNTWERSVWAPQGQASAHENKWPASWLVWVIPRLKSCYDQVCGFPTPSIYQPFACCSSCTPLQHTVPVCGTLLESTLLPLWQSLWPWHAAAYATWTRTWRSSLIEQRWKPSKLEKRNGRHAAVQAESNAKTFAHNPPEACIM